MHHPHLPHLARMPVCETVLAEATYFFLSTYENCVCISQNLSVSAGPNIGLCSFHSFSTCQSSFWYISAPFCDMQTFLLKMLFCAHGRVSGLLITASYCRRMTWTLFFESELLAWGRIPRNAGKATGTLVALCLFPGFGSSSRLLGQSVLRLQVLTGHVIPCHGKATHPWRQHGLLCDEAEDQSRASLWGFRGDIFLLDYRKPLWRWSWRAVKSWEEKGKMGQVLMILRLRPWTEENSSLSCTSRVIAHVYECVRGFRSGAIIWLAAPNMTPQLLPHVCASGNPLTLDMSKTYQFPSNNEQKKAHGMSRDCTKKITAESHQQFQERWKVLSWVCAYNYMAT